MKAKKERKAVTIKKNYELNQWEVWLINDFFGEWVLAFVYGVRPYNGELFGWECVPEDILRNVSELNRQGYTVKFG